MMVPAILFSAILFNLQIWNLINLPIFGIALPIIIIASAIILPVLLFAWVVALIYHRKDEGNPR